MDIKDSYLHGTVGVVKSISVSADKLKYKLADIAGTVKEVTLPVATTSANGLMSSGDKTKLDNLSSTIGNYVTLNTDQEITGTKTFTKQLKFTVAKGTAPFLVTSDTKVDNLNADLLDGLDSTRYLHSVAYDANLDFNVVKGINDKGGCVNNANYILSGDNQLSNSPYSYGIMTTLNNGAAGMDFATNGPLGFTIGLKFRKRWLNNLSEWKEIAFTDSNITGNAATATHASTADKLKTKRKLWGRDFDGSSDITGSIYIGNTYVGNNQVIYGTDAEGNTLAIFYPLWSNGVTYLNYGPTAFHLRNKSSETVLYADSGKNIGIGTDKPTSKLDVVGSLKCNQFFDIRDNSDVKKRLTLQVSGGVGRIYAYNETDSSYLALMIGRNDNKALNISSAGNVGINKDPSTEKLDVNGNVKATSFIGNLDGTYINALTGYSKATSIAALATTDTLNTALGKLEYKANVAYDLVKGAYDGDGTIENLAEILKVLEGISDTETINAIIGKYLPLTGGTLTGSLSVQDASINVRSNKALLRFLSAGDITYIESGNSAFNDNTPLKITGYNGFTGSDLYLLFNHIYCRGGNYTNLDSGNTYINNGAITINGTSITPLTLHQSLANYVTLNTDQVVSGKKLFNNQLIIRKDVGATGASVTDQQHNLLLQVMRYSDTHSVAIGVMPTGSGVIWAKANGIGYNTLYLNPHSKGVAIGCGNSTLPDLNDGYYFHIFGATLSDDNITANKFIKSGGTSSQFLKADGSLDSNTYATTSSLGNYVTLNTNLTITGSKTFTNRTFFSGTISTQQYITVVSHNDVDPGYKCIRFSFKDDSDKGAIHWFYNKFLGKEFAENTINIQASYGLVTLGNWIDPALTATYDGSKVGIGTTTPTEKLHVKGNALATKFITSGGTSSQFVKGDGSLDSNTYITTSTLNNYIPRNDVNNINTVSGAGETRYIKIATISFSITQLMYPLVFEISGRSINTSLVEIRWVDTNATSDPELNYIHSNGYNGFYINKESTSTWSLYIALVTSWGAIKVHRIQGNNKYNVTINNERVSSIPSTSIASTYYNIASSLLANHAISSKAFSLNNTSWTDTGYTFKNLDTGTYAVQVTSGSNLVASGIMSVYKNLSDTAGDEIPLHVYGTAGWRPYLRTYANKLLISSNDASATSRTVTIKIALIL